MKKVGFILILYFGWNLIGCCNSDSSGELIIVERIATSFQNPYNYSSTPLELNPEDVRFFVFADSIRRESITSISMANIGTLYACDDGYYQILDNNVDSLKIFTVYDYNSQFPAQSEITTICEPQRMPAEFDMYNQNIEYRILEILENDSIQLRVTGYLENYGPFECFTNLEEITQ